MTQHNTIVSIHQMLDHSKEAVEMAKGYTRSDLDTNRMLSLDLILERGKIFQFKVLFYEYCLCS